MAGDLSLRHGSPWDPTSTEEPWSSRLTKYLPILIPSAVAGLHFSLLGAWLLRSHSPSTVALVCGSLSGMILFIISFAYYSPILILGLSTVGILSASAFLAALTTALRVKIMSSNLSPVITTPLLSSTTFVASSPPLQATKGLIQSPERTSPFLHIRPRQNESSSQGLNIPRHRHRQRQPYTIVNGAVAICCVSVCMSVSLALTSTLFTVTSDTMCVDSVPNQSQPQPPHLMGTNNPRWNDNVTVPLYLAPVPSTPPLRSSSSASKASISDRPNDNQNIDSLSPLTVPTACWRYQFRVLGVAVMLLAVIGSTMMGAIKEGWLSDHQLSQLDKILDRGTMSTEMLTQDKFKALDEVEALNSAEDGPVSEFAQLNDDEVAVGENYEESEDEDESSPSADEIEDGDNQEELVSYLDTTGNADVQQQFTRDFKGPPSLDLPHSMDITHSPRPQIHRDPGSLEEDDINDDGDDISMPAMKALAASHGTTVVPSFDHSTSSSYAYSSSPVKLARSASTGATTLPQLNVNLPSSRHSQELPGTSHPLASQPRLPYSLTPNPSAAPSAEPTPFVSPVSSLATSGTHVTNQHPPLSYSHPSPSTLPSLSPPTSLSLSHPSPRHRHSTLPVVSSSPERSPESDVEYTSVGPLTPFAKCIPRLTPTLRLSFAYALCVGAAIALLTSATSFIMHFIDPWNCMQEISSLSSDSGTNPTSPPQLSSTTSYLEDSSIFSSSTVSLLSTIIGIATFPTLPIGPQQVSTLITDAVGLWINRAMLLFSLGIATGNALYPLIASQLSMNGDDQTKKTHVQHAISERHKVSAVKVEEAGSGINTERQQQQGTPARTRHDDPNYPIVSRPKVPRIPLTASVRVVLATLVLSFAVFATIASMTYDRELTAKDYFTPDLLQESDIASSTSAPRSSIPFSTTPNSLSKTKRGDKRKKILSKAEKLNPAHKTQREESSSFVCPYIRRYIKENRPMATNQRTQVPSRSQQSGPTSPELLAARPEPLSSSMSSTKSSSLPLPSRSSLTVLVCLLFLSGSFLGCYFSLFPIVAADCFPPTDVSSALAKIQLGAFFAVVAIGPLVSLTLSISGSFASLLVGCALATLSATLCVFI